MAKKQEKNQTDTQQQRNKGKTNRYSLAKKQEKNKQILNSKETREKQTDTQQQRNKRKTNRYSIAKKQRKWHARFLVKPRLNLLLSV